MKTDGKKVVVIFLIATVICGYFAFSLIRRGYETRPQIPIEEEKKN